MRLTFHLASSPDPFDTDGAYAPPSLADEGLVHCTDGADALAATANRYYASHAGELWALLLDLSQVASPWRIDAPGTPYPHVYGSIPRSAVLATRALQRDRAGSWLRPDLRPPGVALAREDRSRLLREYAEGPALVREALGSVPPERLESSAGGWSPAEVALHLADSESLSGIRLRKLLAEDFPYLAGYDEEAYVRLLPSGRGVEASLRLIEATRAASAELLTAIEDAAWHRCGWHGESGLYSVEGWLRIYAAHCRDHARQIREAA
jgi:uncharacterized protein (DUF952 family)